MRDAAPDLQQELNRALAKEKELRKQLHNLEEQLRYHKKKLLAYQKEELASNVQSYRNLYKDIGHIYYCWLIADKEDLRDIDRIEVIDDMLERVKGGEDGMGHMRHDINRQFNNVLVHLKSDYPDIRPADYNLFCYLTVGFGYYLIVELLGLPGVNALYARKTRLKQKLTKLNSAHTPSYLALIE
jgi:hypothetical protein